MCQGPFENTDCRHETEEEHGVFVEAVLQKVKDVWSADMEMYPYIEFQVSTGSTPPILLHEDTAAITMMLYLSDGGAKTVFPKPNVAIEPKKGTLSLWLNVDGESRPNVNAFHAVQAHPDHSGERITAIMRIERSALAKT